MKLSELLLTLAIPSLLRARMTANESSTRAALKTIAAALETHASDTGVGYPTNISALLEGDPPYINRNYIAESPIEGYNYGCDFLEVGGYSCSATPVSCNQTGSKIYTITTGALFSEKECN